MRLIDDFLNCVHAVRVPPEDTCDWRKLPLIDFDPLIKGGVLSFNTPPRTEIPMRLPFPSIVLYGDISTLKDYPVPLVLLVRETSEAEDRGIITSSFYRPTPHDWQWVSRYFIACDLDWLPLSPLSRVPVADPLRLSPFIEKHPDRDFRAWCRETTIVGSQVAGKIAQLLNCKNMRLEEHDPMKDFKPRVRKHWEKQGREPLPKHHTLSVRVPGSVLISKKRTDGAQRGPVPLHTCRGHFSTYSENAKLFGKYTGTFWVPAHVRGAATYGEVTKDYKLIPGVSS